MQPAPSRAIWASRCSRRCVMRTIRAAVLGAALLTAVPAQASRLDEAEATVAAELARLGVDRSRIKSVYLAPNGYGREKPAQSYTGFVSFNDCRGHLVIDLPQTGAVLPNKSAERRGGDDGVSICML